MLQESAPGPTSGALGFILRLLIVGQFVYNLLTSRQTISKYYDHQKFHNPGLITDDLVEYVYTTAHQPNSRYALISFLSDSLNVDAHEATARLQMPVIVVVGREGEGMFSASEVGDAFKQVNAQIEVHILAKCSYHLQDEQAVHFNSLVRDFAAATVTQ